MCPIQRPYLFVIYTLYSKDRGIKYKDKVTKIGDATVSKLEDGFFIEQ